MLCALTGSRLDRRLGAALWTFAAMIGLATVLLGWHYAIDVHAGALGTVVIWHGVGWAAEGRRAMAAHRRPLVADGAYRVRQEG